MSGRREAPLLTETLRAQRIPHFAEIVRTMDELRVASSLFKTTTFRVLHVSAHGNNDGTGFYLTDGSLVCWQVFFDLFHFHQERSYLTLSACSVLKGSAMADSLLRADFPPKEVIGPIKPVTWESAAVVNSALIQSLRSSSVNDVIATLAGLYLAFGMDLHAVGRTLDKTATTRISGSLVLEVLFYSLLRREKSEFMNLIHSRGLLSPGECSLDWEELWKRSEQADRNLRDAIDAHKRLVKKQAEDGVKL